MLSRYWLATLPPGRCACLMTASLPWQAPQVASRRAKFVREVGSLDFWMSCVPWQSPQLAATVLPLARAFACAVARYSLTGTSWQLAQFAGFSVGACGSFSSDTSLWQSVHLNCIWPCTEPANALASTPIDLPLDPLVAGSLWHIMQDAFGSAAEDAVCADTGPASAAARTMTRADSE